VRKIADEAVKSSRIGARALKAVWGKIIKPYEFDPFGQPDVKKDGDRYSLVVDEPVVMRALRPPL
jgi:ATP-dependent Clp protease ATP-binding subunit ClpX